MGGGGGGIGIGELEGDIVLVCDGIRAVMILCFAITLSIYCT